ncbi:MAG: MAPEG family protein [Myxococcaceae bacterium]|jgi:uncharacterized membrane protein YecN with MAPEG domain|nr:MAPEG family protein [Myxococcaceae bacterium]MCA3015701.1 MAPEG family protein [Myxococcaceae bacterium]
MHVSITLLYGGLTFLFVVALGINVTRLRAVSGKGLGTMPPEFAREIRAHGNAAEWAPLTVVLLLLLELSGLSSGALHVLGGVMLASRVLHGLGALSERGHPLVAVGSVGTYLVALVMGGWALARHFG